MGEKKKKDSRDGGKYSLSSMQEVKYQREFKMADRAGGYADKRTRL
ncbi:YfhE family protein [Neobacillus jeddahensis]|nr:YfhE family protein [Neobacillus jeddahensis]